MLLLFCVGLGQNYSKLSKNEEANLDGNHRRLIRTEEALRKPNSGKQRKSAKFS